MKQISLLILVFILLTGCSAARPVIRTEKAPEWLSVAQDAGSDNASSRQEQSALQVQGPVVIATKAHGATKPSDTPEKIISASDRTVGQPVTQGEQGKTRPKVTQPAQTTSATASKAPDASSEAESGGALSGGEEAPKTSRYKLLDYYPLIPNRRVDFSESAGTGSALLLQYVYEDQGEALAQVKQVNAVGSLTNVIRVTPEEISELYYSQDLSYRLNIMGRTDYEERVILKTPLQVGAQWESSGLQFTISAVDEPRVIQETELNVLEVTVTAGQEKYLFTYALGIGLISHDVINADGSLSNILRYEGIKEGARDTYRVEFFFPGADGALESVTWAVSFGTNDISSEILGKAYQGIAAAQGLSQVMGPEAEILYLFLNGNIIYADVNEDFVDFIDEDPDLEDIRLQAFVNTVTGFFQAQGLVLTVNDQRYESDHRKIEKTEILKPSTQPSSKDEG